MACRLGGEHSTCPTPGVSGLAAAMEQHDRWAGGVAVVVDGEGEPIAAHASRTGRRGGLLEGSGSGGLTTP